MPQRDNTGALFRNDRRVEGSNQPTHTGKCLIDGTEYRISAWINEGKKGRYFSLVYTPQLPVESEPEPARLPQPPVDDGEEIPF